MKIQLYRQTSQKKPKQKQQQSFNNFLECPLLRRSADSAFAFEHGTWSLSSSRPAINGCSFHLHGAACDVRCLAGLRALRSRFIGPPCNVRPASIAYLLRESVLLPPFARGTLSLITRRSAGFVHFLRFANRMTHYNISQIIEL